MNNKEKQGYLDEINYQKKMINNLTKWLRNLFILSSLGIIVAYYFSNNLILTIIGYGFTIICIICCIFVGKAIYSGRKNINKLIDSFDMKYKKVSV